MEIQRNGKFTHTVSSAQLSKGLRSDYRGPRNSDFLIKCIGAVGKDRVLSVLEEFTRLDTSVITDSFPYPQIFVFVNHIIVCSSNKIYELNGTVLTEKLTASVVSSTWDAVDFYDYIYMSNGKVAVTRDPKTQEWNESADLPSAIGICNYNGQVLIGSPNVEL